MIKNTHHPTITIGHLDTGVSAEHPALIGRVRKFIAIDKNGNVMKKRQAYDSGTHGTHTAGIIFASVDNEVQGLAPEIKLCVVSIPAVGKTLLSLLTGMDALLDCNIDIACMPVGVLQKTPLFMRMLEAFHAKDVLVIAPSGNKGEGNVHAPGCYPDVLSVGAVDKNGRVAKFSGSYCDEKGLCLKPDIVAPGVDILSAAPGNKAKKRSGTSMACAYVIGIAAGLLQSKPQAKPDDIKKALLATTKQLPSNQRHRCRTGIIQPKAALNYLLNGAGPSPAPDMAECPLFLKQPYIDRRLLNKYKRAKPEEPVESIVMARKHDQGQHRNSTSELLERMREESAVAPGTVRFFRNADMAYVQAGRPFYAELLKQSDLFVCSAVDVGIFEN